jgi:ABC-type uncharacterized transport system fused permease/ATPase subunit
VISPLLLDLTFKVPQGVNVMVTGPNGAGKSSLFRVIGELWPLHNGVMTKPGKEEILFVPQKPYLVLGTLRDQIIYPHTVEDMKVLFFSGGAPSYPTAEIGSHRRRSENAFGHR